MIPPGTALGGVQVQLGNGPVVGRVDDVGRFLNLGKLENWWGAASSTSTYTQRTNAHGEVAGPAFYAGRVVVLEVRVDGFGPADSLAAAQLISRELPVDHLVPLVVTDEAETLTAMVRQEGQPMLSRQGNRVTLNLSMKAPDPFRYGPQMSLSTGLPATSGGLSLPITTPVSLRSASVSGSVQAINTGDVESDLLFQVAGPVGAFTIADTTGRQLANTDGVPEGRVLYIDTAARQALLDGTASRAMTGTWPRLQPGANTFSFNAATYSSAARMTVVYRSARR